MKLELSFAHPDRILGPNGNAPLTLRGAKAHALAKMGTKMKTRDAAFADAMSALNDCPQRNFPAKLVEATWYYKGIIPDVDNVVARLKPLIDGCAQAFGINDRNLELGRVRRVHTLDKKLAGTISLTFDTECETAPPDEAIRRDRDNLRRLLGEVLAFAELGVRDNGNGKAACVRVFNLITKYKNLHAQP